MRELEISYLTGNVQNAKKMKEPEDYELRNLVYRTCNHCRFKAYQRIHPLNNMADFNRGTARIVYIGNDTDSEHSVQDRIRAFESELLGLSSSSSAAASSESYFMKEPEPEPEPDEEQF